MAKAFLKRRLIVKYRFLALILPLACACQAAPRLVTQETTVATLRPDAVVAVGSQFDSLPFGYHLQWSADMKHVSYWAASKKGLYAVIDDVAGKPYPIPASDRDRGEIEPPSVIFSPDGRHHAYLMAQGKKQFAVKDGFEGAAYDWIAPGDLHFSADSRRMAYWARRGGKNIMVLHDGTRVKEFPFNPQARQSSTPAVDAVAPPQSDVWRVEERNGKFAVVFKGKESATYDALYDMSPVAGPDGRHFAWRAERNGNMLIVLDGIEAGVVFPGASGLRLPPLLFNGSDEVYTLVLQDREIRRVTVKIQD